jgi:flavin-dependent thymidylate synthase
LLPWLIVGDGVQAMKVALIDFTGNGHPDPADYAARLLIYCKSTRLTQGEDLKRQIATMPAAEVQRQLAEILMTIRSSWEFVEYTWQVTGVTRAFTHQFVRSRHASFAQQAMRVADMSEFEHLIPDTVKKAGKEEMWRLCMQMIASTYSSLREAGVPAQDARGVLPTNVLTNIVAKMNLRAFAELVGKRENLRAQGEYADAVRLMKAEVLLVHPWTKMFLEPERTRTPAVDAMLKAALGDASPVDKPDVNAALKEVDMLKATWG